MKYVFVCGMPRSGTTILAKEIGKFANCTAFENTGVMMDEGQYLQDVYPTEWACGGAGRFGFDPRAHVTENSSLLTPDNVGRLRQSWEAYWGKDKTICVEKSPGNLLKTRFLQAAFPGAYFVVIKRHPVAVSLATQKWSLTPLHELLEHWLRCHQIFDADKRGLNHLYELSYEDYIANPQKYLAAIANFLGTEFSGSLKEKAADGYNKNYFDRWARMLHSSPFKAYYRRVADEYEDKFQQYGYSLAPLSVKTALVSGEPKPARGIFCRLLCLGFEVFFAVWRVGRAFRIRLEDGFAGMTPGSVARKAELQSRDTSRMRILVLGPDCNPETVSIPFVAYSHAAALARRHDVTLVVQSSVEDRVRRAKAPFRSIEVVQMPLVERLFVWGFRRILRGNYDTEMYVAFLYPVSLAFEWHAWRQLRRRILAGEFDAVLRVLPMTPVLPSPFAYFLRNGPVPFVLGPLNGGLRDAPGFSQRDKPEWVFSIRNLCGYLPFAKSTYRHAAAIIVATSHMRSQFAGHLDKLFFIPENGISRALCVEDTRRSEPGAKLKLMFVGGLVRRKACYLGLRAAALILRSGLAHFTLIGDGPERPRLEELVKSLEIENAVTFCGWLTHAEVLSRLRSADVVVLPAIREGGGGVVFEALAAGAVPVILDWGGPGDIVHPDVGFKVPPTNEEDVVSRMEEILSDLAGDRDLLSRLRQHGMAYARECLTWDAKATASSQVLNWAVRRGPKPDLPWSKMAQVRCVS